MPASQGTVQHITKHQQKSGSCALRTYAGGASSASKDTASEYYEYFGLSQQSTLAMPGPKRSEDIMQQAVRSWPSVQESARSVNVRVRSKPIIQPLHEELALEDLNACTALASNLRTGYPRRLFASVCGHMWLAYGLCRTLHDWRKAQLKCLGRNGAKTTVSLQGCLLNDLQWAS